MKRIYISILFVFVLTFANAQSYEIDAYNGQTVSTCAGTFYDSGGSAANYSNGETYTVTFCSANVGEQITVAFSSFITQGTLDKLAVYEGGPTSTSLKGTYSGTLSAFSVTSSTGCLTFKFTSDGTTNKAGWIAALSCAPSQPSTCVNAGPFCTGSTESYPATTGITGAQSEFPSGIGCLYTTPNPVYYYLKISNTGSLVINMSSADASGTGNDVDFICWGPFTDPTSNCIAGLNSSTEVDCSYSTAAAETCTIPSAVVGQYYLLLLTNYANVASNITFSQTSGVGATDCNIVNPTCVISAVTATPSACNATTNTYSLSGSVTFADAPSTGTLTVTDGNGHTQTFTAPFTSPTAYSFTGITSNGASVTITASFSGDPDCNNTTTYTAPASCATCSVEAGPNVTICSGTGTTLTATGGSVWSWTSSPTTTITNPTAASITVSPTATTRYTVVATTNGTCTAGDFVDVTVNPIPAAPTVTTPVTYCQSTTATALSATTTGTLNWYGTSATGGTASTTAPIPSTTTVGTTTYYVSQTINGCEGPRASISVTVNATPVAPTVAPVTYCQNATAIALNATVTGTVNWYGTNATGGTASTTAPIPSTSTAGTTNYYVSQTINGCEGPRASITVTVNATPAAPTVAPVTYCQNATAIALNATVTGTVNWYGTNATGGTASTTAPIPSTSIAGTTNYYVSQTINGCEGPRASITVTVNATPTLPTVTTPVSYCQNTTAVALSATPSTGGALNWYGTNATGGTASTTAPI
ncbi:MAG: CUB domain-containing protein, partial [Bacteroidota bacterium]